MWGKKQNSDSLSTARIFKNKQTRKHSAAKRALQQSEPVDFSYYVWGRTWHCWGHTQISSCPNVLREVCVKFGAVVPSRTSGTGEEDAAVVVTSMGGGTGWDHVMVGAGLVGLLWVGHGASQELLVDFNLYLLKPHENHGLLCQTVSEAFSAVGVWAWLDLRQRLPAQPVGIQSSRTGPLSSMSRWHVSSAGHSTDVRSHFPSQKLWSEALPMLNSPRCRGCPLGCPPRPSHHSWAEERPPLKSHFFFLENATSGDCGGR